MAKPLFMVRILVAISFFTSLFFAAGAQSVPEATRAQSVQEAGKAQSVQEAARALSVQEIVARHIEALGGKEKLQSLNSVYQEGTAILPSGAQLSLKIWRVYDRLYREELDFGVGKIVVIVTPRQGWVSGPSTGAVFKPLPEAQVKALQMEIDPAGALADYSAKGNKIERAGLDTVNGRPCYLVRVWFPNNQFIIYSIDAKTWYILRERRKAGGIMGEASSDLGWHMPPDGNIDIRFDDYRNTRGAYIFPFGMTIAGLGRINIKKIEINGTVDVKALSKAPK